MNGLDWWNLDDSAIVELNGADNDDAADKYLDRIKRDLGSLLSSGPT